MENLIEIRRKLFENNDAKRIIIKMNTKNLNSEDYETSAKEIASEVFPGWEDNPRIIFLVIDIWSERSFLVIDIDRHDYDFDTAHKCKTVVPVHILRQHRRLDRWALVRWPQQDEPLASQIADLHNVNGFDAATPFVEDHTSRLVHANPREFPSSNGSVRID